MPQKTSLTRSRFFADYQHPNAVMERNEAPEVDAMLGGFSLDTEEEEETACVPSQWTMNFSN